MLRATPRCVTHFAASAAPMCGVRRFGHTSARTACDLVVDVVSVLLSCQWWPLSSTVWKPLPIPAMSPTAACRGLPEPMSGCLVASGASGAVRLEASRTGEVRQDAHMKIAEARLPDHADQIVGFMVNRAPKQDRTILRADLDQGTARSLRVLVAREPDGALAGVAFARTSANLPAGALFVTVSTRADLGGRGLGSRLFAAALAEPDDDVIRLVGCVLDGDQPSMDVALHWGFERKQTSITSAFALDNTVPAEPPHGVTVEVCDELTFNDDVAVEAMLRASQTNPEADLGLVLTLQGLREAAAPGQRPVAVLTRVEGRPAGFAFALGDGDQMHLMYTGVDPSLRGRALGRLTKEFLHRHARDLGIRMALTENDENNAGIRHVNEQLGYTGHSAWLWMMRPLHGPWVPG